MPLSNAEKQARFRERQKQYISELEADNERLRLKVNKLLQRLREQQRVTGKAKGSKKS